jgi:hypothetical protein
MATIELQTLQRYGNLFKHTFMWDPISAPQCDSSSAVVTSHLLSFSLFLVPASFVVNMLSSWSSLLTILAATAAVTALPTAELESRQSCNKYSK